VSNQFFSEIKTHISCQINFSEIKTHISCQINFSEIRVVYDMTDKKSTADPEAKEIDNHMSLIWFHADNEAKDTNVHFDPPADLRISRKQARIK
jgi:uncharacterized protein (DUF2225 family)